MAYWSVLTYWSNGTLSIFFPGVPNCHPITDQGTRGVQREGGTFHLLVLPWRVGKQLRLDLQVVF